MLVKYTIHWSYAIHFQYIDPMEMCSHVCVTHTLWQGTEVSPMWWRHRPVQSGVNWWCHHQHTGRHSECRFPEVLLPRITKTQESPGNMCYPYQVHMAIWLNILAYKGIGWGNMSVAMFFVVSPLKKSKQARGSGQNLGQGPFRPLVVTETS